jgi:hypothetical protein
MFILVVGAIIALVGLVRGIIWRTDAFTRKLKQIIIW